jgi:hypothetical protein
MMTNMPEHLDAEAIYTLLEGELDPSRDGVAEAHLLRCDACRALRDECAATLGALRWYGEREAVPPDGYWDGFWRRWPVAGDLPSRHAVMPRWAVAAAAVAILVGGGWWMAERRGNEAARLASQATASLAPASGAPAPRDLVAGTAWESDVEVMRRVTFTIGSIDPLSKGVVLASLAEEP